MINAELLLNVLGVLAALLVTHLVVDRQSRLSALLSWGPLVGIGQVSYGLYLWHWAWLQYPLTLDAHWLPLALILTCVTVVFSYYVIERRALRLKRRFRPEGAAQSASTAIPERSHRVSRRDLLPVLGMGS